MAKFDVPNFNDVNRQSWKMRLEMLPVLRRYHQMTAYSVRMSISKITSYDDLVEDPDASGEGVRSEHLDDCQLDFLVGAVVWAVEAMVEDEVIRKHASRRR